MAAGADFVMCLLAAWLMLGAGLDVVCRNEHKTKRYLTNGNEEHRRRDTTIHTLTSTNVVSPIAVLVLAV